MVTVAALIFACGGDEPTGAPTSSGDTSPATTASTNVAVPPTAVTTPPGTSAPSTSPPTTEAADTAPDFTLELGNGGTFVLSEEARPVFLVFWAEW